MPTSVAEAAHRRNIFERTRDAWEETPGHVIVMTVMIGIACICFAYIAYVWLTFPAVDPLARLP